MDEQTADVLIEARIIQLRNETVAARESRIHVRRDMAGLQAQLANLDARRPEVKMPGAR